MSSFSYMLLETLLVCIVENLNLIIGEFGWGKVGPMEDIRRGVPYACFAIA